MKKWQTIEDVMLDPTELAKALGVKNAQKMNVLLAAIGLQEEDEDGLWMPTMKGLGLSIKSRHDFKWNVQAVKKLLDEEASDNDNLMPLYPV